MNPFRRLWPVNVGFGEDGFMGRVFGLFWACVWLFWLLQPAATVFHHADQPKAWIGSLCTVAFAVVYVWHFMRRQHLFIGGVGATDPGTYLRFGLLVSLCIASFATLGSDGSASLVFTAISGLWTFAFPTAALLAVAEIAIYLGAAHYFDSRVDSGTLVGLGFGMAAVSMGMLAGRRQRALLASREENAVLAVEDERNRMARDLHDILGHSLTVITVKAELAGRLMDTDPQRARSEIADLERLSRTALGDVRKAVEGYREISLPGELVRAREALAAAGVIAHLPSAIDDVPEDLQETMAWVVREGVTNVLRHARASECWITVHDGVLTIRDDGAGPTETGSGNGLRGLRERATAAGAVLVSRTVEPRGFELSLHSPSLPITGG